MYAQAVLKPNTLLRNGAYGIVMRGVHFCTRGCSCIFAHGGVHRYEVEKGCRYVVSN